MDPEKTINMKWLEDMFEEKMLIETNETQDEKGEKEESIAVRIGRLKKEMTEWKINW